MLVRQFFCPQCRRCLQVGLERIGRKVQCPNCGTKFPRPRGEVRLRKGKAVTLLSHFQSRSRN